MEKPHPERKMDSAKIRHQHELIMDELNNLIAAAAQSDVDNMRRHFDSFNSLLLEHFHDEEEVLASLNSSFLKAQQREHGILSRMLSNMSLLMQSDNPTTSVQWQTTVIDEAIDALAQHFAKEDEDFIPLLDQNRRRINHRRKVA
jgi:hemerythrin